MSKAPALILAGLIASPALASRIAVAPFTGPGANPIRNQLVDALCEEADCVPQGKVISRGKPDWKKAKRLKVAFVVTGKVKKRGRKVSVELAVLAGPGRTKHKKAYPVVRGRLPGKAIAAVQRAVGGGRAEPPPEEPPEETSPEPPEEPVAEASGSESSDPPSRGSPDEPPRPVVTATPEAEKEPDSVLRDSPTLRIRRGSPFLIAEVGPDFFSRRFAYSEVQTANLRSYRADLVVAPRLQAEVYPLASSRGLVSGLGVEAGYAFAVGLKSRRTDGQAHPTSLSRLDLAAKLRVQPLDDLPLVLIPQLGYRSASFAVGAAPDGSLLDGLPGISYSSLVPGAAVELSLLEGTLLPFARFSYLSVLSSGEIISASYFPNGSASGIEGAVGVGYLATPNIEVRLTGELTRYSLTFHTSDGDKYIAAGAADQYVGAKLGLRYRY